MSVSDPAPGDDDVEMAVIGDMLAFAEAVPVVAAVLEPSDFRHPTCGTAYDILVRAHKEGRQLDGAVLQRELEAAGRGLRTDTLMEMLAAGSGAYMEHAKIVVEHRMRRDAIAALTEARTQLHQPLPPEDVIAQLQARLERVDAPVGRPPPDLMRVDDFLTVPDGGDVFDEWVIPGLLRRGWRCILVAAEGAGKSVMLRAMAVSAAHAIHPFHFQPLDAAVRVLFIDLENPAGTVRRSLRTFMRLVADQRPENIHVWCQPAGINVVTRQGRRDLESAVQASSPALVLLGPLYKSYRRRDARQSDEEAATECQTVLDDLRNRYGFALVIEHHAPHGDPKTRQMRPFGSSAWLRWPELGFGLERAKSGKDSQGELALTRWRADRDLCSWPERFRPGQTWPWTGVWKDGAFEQQQSF